ncbi:hypothetical protein QBC39DRAFT_333685 [Podospora conica]|nr:hypothetical protein QBC39DRAFT_333685 [Schizothecium conicum]
MGGPWLQPSTTAGPSAAVEDETEVGLSLLSGFDFDHIPDDTAILGLVNQFFSDCLAVTYVTNTLVVELPHSDAAEFTRRISQLPSNLQGAPFAVRYYPSLKRASPVTASSVAA